jgi:opacity protein-like surface antigen
MASVLLLCLATADSSAILPVGFYAGPRIGMNIDSNKTSSNSTDGSISDSLSEQDQLKMDVVSGNKSFYIGAVAGVRFLSFRFDLEYGFRNALAKSRLNENLEFETINGHNIFANLYYNVIDLPFVKFYVNGGLGSISFVKNFSNKINSEFSWLAGLGLTFSLFNILNLDFGYRYVDMAKLKLENNTFKQKSNDLFIGLRFGF